MLFSYGTKTNTQKHQPIPKNTIQYQKPQFSTTRATECDVPMATAKRLEEEEVDAEEEWVDVFAAAGLLVGLSFMAADLSVFTTRGTALFAVSPCPVVTSLTRTRTHACTHTCVHAYTRISK